jgi:DNA-binding MarR family transcriptional regulator
MSVVTPNDLGHFYIELHHRLKRMVDDAMAATGISLSRAKVLMQLRDHGPMKQSVLATRLGFAPRSVTDTVDSLERDQLAERVDDPADRRARIVGIAPAGSAALESALATKHQLFEQIFGSLDGPSREGLLAYLMTIDSCLTPKPGECLVNETA